MSELMVKIEIEPLDEGGYLATSDVLEGLIAQGRTVAETLEIAQDVARKIVESYLEHGDPLPDALKGIAFSKNSERGFRIPIGMDGDRTPV
ncbi:MAG: type II toxin-antitoxin system HicB family antitoxin [Chthonomonadales bacterium]